jgi:NitT/TauT family transport system permease protein
LISVLSSLVFGILSGLIKSFYNLMKPVVAILKAVPTMAIVILALIWLESEKAPILIGIILVFPVLYHSVVEGMLNVDIKLLQMANLYSVSKKYIIKDIYLPVICSYLSSSIGAALGLTLKAVIAGEVLGQPKYSIGGSMQLEKMYLNTSGVFAWIIIVVLISVIVEGSIKLLFFKVNKWKDI